MSYLVQNVSGKVQSMPKTLETLSRAYNNWAIGQIDTVDDAVINTYQNHADVFAVLSGPSIFGAAGAVPTATVAAGTSVSDTETGVNRTVLILNNVSVATTDYTTSGAAGSIELYDFPAGLIILLGATTNISIARVGTAIQANAAVVGALGTVAAAGDATLTSTEANIVPSTASTLTSGAGVTHGQNAAVAFFDGTATSVKAFLNFAMPDAGSTGNDALLVNGTITMVWTDAGDY